jgi:GMP synthase (glutamine-hydrolysing)
MKSVCVLQHADCETPGLIGEALAGCALQTIRPYAGETVPRELGAAAALVVMGGPQSVYEQDKFPHLRDELRLIEQALRDAKPILGVCLGSQLLAAALGANVHPGKQKEIGWFDVTLRDDPLWAGAPRQFTAFHWHGDVFDLPRGATSLASSAFTPHQAFRYGVNACGLLFHLEVTAPQIAGMTALFGDELHRAGVDGRAILSGTRKHLPALQEIGAAVFRTWATTLS